jgi:osmotically-inducible protein OsmY
LRPRSPQAIAIRAAYRRGRHAVLGAAAETAIQGPTHNPKGDCNMTDEQLRSDAQDELRWEPKVDSRAIAVSAADGIVTLRGTVGSFREKRDAESAVKRIYGTKDVENKLQVKLLNDDRRDDADLRGAVLQALILDGLVPATVDAKVDDGNVLLSGTAKHQFERDEAAYVAGNVKGVLWVKNDIQLAVETPKPADVQDAIKKAFARDAKVDAARVNVDSNNGTVRLSGSVQSWAEHDAALNAAWAAPGVEDVDDRIEIV